MYPLTLAALLVVVAGSAGPARAADPAIDGPTTVPPHRLARFAASGLAPKAGILWRVRPLEDANKGRVDLATRPNAPELVFVAPPGRYLVELTTFTVADGTVVPAFAERLVEIQGSAPPEPGPAPPPAPPGPASPLRVKLKAAYDADAMAGPGKDAARRFLSRLYVAGARAVATDRDITTVRAAIQWLRAAAAVELPDDQIRGVRQVIADELATAFPADADLTDELRAKVAATFAEIGAALNW